MFFKRCKWREQIFETKGDALCRVTLIQNYRQKMNRKLFPILQWKLAAGMFMLTLLWWGEILRVQTLNIVRLTSILTQTCLNFFIIFGRNVVQLKKIDQQKEIHKFTNETFLFQLQILSQFSSFNINLKTPRSFQIQGKHIFKFLLCWRCLLVTRKGKKH